MILVPGGTKDILLKSWLPNKYAQDDNDGFTREFHSKFNISSPWSMSLSHSLKGKSGSHVANPASK